MTRPTNTAVTVAAPPTASGYDATRLNAVRHGVLSRYAVLPWEDEAEYQTLVDVLICEHAPSGATEMHLVVELAGVLWRKRRLRLAERATYKKALHATTESFSGTARSALVLYGRRVGKVDVAEAIRSGDADPNAVIVALEADRRMTEAALAILATASNRAYDDALAALHEETREAWREQLGWAPEDYEDGQTPYTADGESLARFLTDEILPWYERQRTETAMRPMVRAQALGEALDPDRLERLGKYEVHLDRKLERTLSTLLRLQELRRGRAGDGGGGASGEG